VNLNQLRVTANDELAFNFEKKIKSMTNLFDVSATAWRSIGDDERLRQYVYFQREA
jgi:hypothetical protein